MIRIIERILVTTAGTRKLFLPCDIPILTRQTQASLRHIKAQHSAYEIRQVKGVRRRLFNGTSLPGSASGP